MYRSAGELVTLAAREMHGALASGRPVLAALPKAHLGMLRDALDGAADQVTWIDMAAAGRNPGRILPGVLTAFEQANAGTPVTMVGEPIWPGRSPHEYDAALAHEALINVAFEDRPVTVICPYDADGLSPRALEDARRTHPQILDRTGTHASEDFADPVALAVEASDRLSAPPEFALATEVLRPEDLSTTRHLLAAQARLAGVDEERTERFVLACHEAMANALRHGGGRGDVALWREDDSVVCQVSSPGPFADVMAGRRLVEPTADCGRGLVMINELCDLVQLRATPDGATIQMRVAAR
jgi:anti-sigma regulatory factor (Ser/Thr protein kinase)